MKKPNPYAEYGREALINEYKEALGNHDTLFDFYMTRLIYAGRGSKLTDAEMAMDGVLETVAAVALADAVGEDWPVADLLDSGVLLRDRVRSILADWLRRTHERTVPSHQLSPADKRLREAERFMKSLAGKHKDEIIIRLAAEKKGLEVRTLKNFLKGRRGSSWRSGRR